ncbi:DUF6226 family protein [Microbacterium sp. ZKA21]|uniref:DUF6226 family protein n=1 Tax=Microbacterium sp. ZKA21 TaxID=3381694 RepID=UPI003D1E4F7F
MNAYVRPPIDPPVFRDAAGEVIDYGNRWPDSPPEETYSVDTHPERFAPLHTVADALIVHLRDVYDVEIIENRSVIADLLRPPYFDVTKAVRIQPNDPACATLTFVFTAYPGLYVHAGLLHDFHFPVCGCDACDTTWDAEADGLEQLVFALVGGHYRELVGPEPWVGFALTFPDGATSGKSRAEDLPVERLEAAMSTLRSRADRWASWPQVASAARP